ncbi:MAG: NAD-dependent protein deacylase [Clostridiales bacterium]|nr:NAD-dependent protein deacylase [Clostridiales bacterium]
MLYEKIEKLKKWLRESNNIIFFGGAGVSTESGIPDFRSVDGVYHMNYKYPPETILSHRFFIENPKEFYRFYRDKMIFNNVSPNITHKKLAQLESEGKVSGVITQNIDGLHQAAGSQKVLELHGSIHRNYCMECHRFYPLSYITEAHGDIPICQCGGIIKPDVVLYEESLNSEILETSVQLISQADLLIVGGTSLSVYPAAGLIRYYQGDKMVLINKTVTSYDNLANLLIQEALGKVFNDI